MSTPRTSAAVILRAAAFVCLILLPLASAQAQTSGEPVTTIVPDDKARAIQLYQQAHYQEAVEILQAVVRQNKDDADAWYHLGLALYRIKDTRGALTALEAAVQLRPKDDAARANLSYVLLSIDKRDDAKKQVEQAIKLNARNVEAHFVKGRIHLLDGERDKALQEAEAALSINAAFVPALQLKARILIDTYVIESHWLNEAKRAALQTQLKATAEGFEQFLKSNPAHNDAKALREEINTLHFYAGLGDGTSTLDGQVFSPREVSVKARIVGRPFPQYPRRARGKRTTGTVVLRVVLAADGKVKNIVVIESPDKDLTEACVQAARQIKFVPAMKDGKPVSQHLQVEYNFNIN